ncbi:MAG: response regulator [Planctomycetales bacterium]|nr:response regulator [Planctomycetales bacterium]
MVELQGGTLRVESSIGKGSVFTCILPTRIVDDAPRAAALTSKPPTTGATAARLDGYEILLAEDGPDNQRLISHVLRKAGAVVQVVENGQEAIDAIVAREDQSAPFDMVLMDMQMPVRDGYSATKEISQRWPELHVAAITAHAMSTDREACINAGCCAYLSKPIDRAALIATCAELGNHAQALSTVREECAAEAAP